jgi:hypothetical protein
LVEVATVDEAWAAVKYFGAHAGKVYRRVRTEPAHDKAVVMMEFISDRGGVATMRDLVTYKVAGCKNKAQVQQVLESLARAGIGKIEVVNRKSGGAPTVQFRLARGGAE